MELSWVSIGTRGVYNVILSWTQVEVEARSQILRSNVTSDSGGSNSSMLSSNNTARSHLVHSSAPFILAHDIPRGVFYAGHSALQFAFMLAAMYVHIVLTDRILTLTLDVGRSISGSFFQSYLGWA